MTANEIRKEMDGDMHYIDGICNGMEITMPRKVRKFWRHTNHTDNVVVDIRRVKTPTRKNTVWVVYVLRLGEDLPVTYCCIFFEQLTKDGRVQLIFRATNPITFTHHTLSRMSERAGLGLKDAIETIAKSGAFYLAPYKYQGTIQSVLSLGVTGLCFCEKDDLGFVAKTFVSRAMLDEDQDATLFATLLESEIYSTQKANEVVERKLAAPA